MDPYVLALQLYLFNKACGGLPLRIAEQVVITGVINTTCWTARTIGSGVMWLIRPSTTSREKTTYTDNSDTKIDNLVPRTLEDTEFEIITPEQIREWETEK
jgi:hypothetical protein